VDDITNQLPTDIDALQTLVAAARVERDAAIAKCDAAIAERDHALSQMDRLRHLLRQLQRAQFGRRSENLAVWGLGCRSGRLSKRITDDCG
jgi:transposase